MHVRAGILFSPRATHAVCEVIGTLRVLALGGSSEVVRITTNCYLFSVLRKVAASAPRLLASEMQRIVFLGQLDGGEYKKTILHPWMFSAVAQEQPLRCRHSAQPPYRTVSMSMHSTPWVEDSFFFI